MEMLCPECMGPLEVVADQRVRCSIHGGQYELLFSRWPLPDGSESSQVSSGEGVVGQPASLPDRVCVNHPGAPAVRLCHFCKTAICETCSFKFPGNLHACPACAASPPDELRPKRLKFLVGSFVCAALATLLFGATLVAGAQVTSEEAIAVLGGVMVYGVLGLTIPGVALSASARAPRRPTSVGVWIALAWNVLLMGLMLLLCLVGLMMGA